ncbi:MAG: iron ABC transporter permease [Erysipelotrichaceae bacterium]|nr:iron ABC transporter permease [Erysipelotrichaceae bacterium]MBQ1323159.1 iron ABC transporter permease [Erysipelotrichaceae bacterium]MBQ1347256.1 iron ABC transporter permease [Erysipelotrichaceae bacterium]MBQ1378480.1 iron ABC transporter permease [Erysipelotrichaceae bacterium]MBQ1776042.1 iron ABC transporter permease [Erysipelotrichaceae bacterium]
MKKRWNRIKTFFSKPYNVLLVLFLVVLTFLVVIPLVSIVRDTFIVHSAEKSRVHQAVGTFTTYHWKRLFASEFSKSLLWDPIRNSIVTSTWACVVSILIGGSFAWLVSRSDMRWKKLLTKLFIFPYIMPSWTLGLAWKNFFKNIEITGSNGIFYSLTGIQVPTWFAYGEFPIIIVTGMHYAPFAYILIGGILHNMDANLEEAAIILKTSRLRMFLRITIPIVMPAVLSTIILVFSGAMASFATPQFLGLPVRYYVLTTELYASINGTNPGVGYILAMIMILISVIIMFVNQKLIGNRKSYATVTGKSANISIFHLGAWRTPISILAFCVVMMMSVIPLVTFALESLLNYTGVYDFNNLTLSFWIGQAQGHDTWQSESGILRNAEVYRTLWNSLRLAFTCALGAGTLGFLAGYSIVRRRGSFLSQVVENLTFIPYLIPSMAFSAIYLSMFATKHGIIPSLYGSFAILALIGTIKYLPMASRSGVNSMLQLSPEIEEAGIIMGVPWLKRMTRIIIPIEKTTIVSGYLLPFISAMRELSLFVILVTANNRVLTTLLLFYDEKGYTQFSNAVNLLIIIVVLFINFAVERLTGASIEKGVGG